MRPRLAILALSFAPSLGGCGYTSGLTLHDPASTIGVEIFANDTRVRDLEASLHSELTGAMERMLEARLVSPGRADYVVRGRLVEYTRRNGIRNSNNMLLESGVRITVEARLIERGAAVPTPPTAAAAAGWEPDTTQTAGELQRFDPPATTQAEFPPRSTAPAQAELDEASRGEKVLRRLPVSAESGFRLEEPEGELEARERCLRNIADRLVLDLFAPLSSEGAP